MSVALLARERVEPAYRWVPEHLSTAGPEAADLAEQAGLFLDAEQRLALDAMYAERPNGKWAAFEFGLICARQNMKTVTFQAAALADLFLFGDELIVWTAHLFTTTQEAFRDIVALVEGADHLRRRCKKPRTANGEEGLETLDGRRLNFRARSKFGGRGLSGDKVFLDEGFALGPAEMGSLLPTMNARPNPQVRYGSSAGMASSLILHGIKDRGRAGGDPSLAYLEWCAPRVPCEHPTCEHRLGTTGCVLDDVQLWHQANPALGRRITVERLAAMRRALPPLEFAREALGWWEDPVDAERVIDQARWSATAKADAGRLQPIAFGVTVTPDRSRATVGAAGRRVDGRVQVELVADEPGVDWVAEWVADRVERWDPCAVVLDGTAAALASDLCDRGVEPVQTSSRDRAQATVAFYDHLMADRVWHPNEPRLNDATVAAKKRPLSDGWVWEGVGVSPLQAVTLAHHGLVVHGAPRPSDPSPVVTPGVAVSETHDLATAGF